MGGPNGNGATQATASSPARAPALALIDGRGEVVRLTESFRAGFAPAGSPHLSIWDFLADPDQRLRLGDVLEGRSRRADVALPSPAGSVAAEAEAVLDATVTRHALLTVSTPGHDPDPRSGADTLLDDHSLDTSPAIVWIKDLSGRYLRINRRYTEHLGIDAPSIAGKTDAELRPAHLVDEPRLLGHAAAQLEYIVEAAHGRPALTVLRFPLHGVDGAAIAVCGVASAVADAAVARSEAERLLRLERWAGLSVGAIRSELFDEWQLAWVAEEVAAAEPAVGPAPSVGAPPAGAAPAVEVASPAELERLREELAVARAGAAELERLVGAERVAKSDLEARLAQEAARGEELDEALADATRRADELVSGAATDSGRLAELEAAVTSERARAEGLAGEVATERARAEELAGEAAAATARAGGAELEAAVEAERVRAAAAEGEVGAARTRAERAERDAAAARARAQGAEREVAAARARVAELKEARATVSTATDSGAADRKAWAELEQRLAEAQRRAEEAERSLAAERAAAAQAHDELGARAEEAEQSLVAERAQAHDELVAAAERAERSLAAERAAAAEAQSELIARAERAEHSLAAERAQVAQVGGELVSRAEEAERSLAAERAAAVQASGELVARAEHAERSLDTERVAAAQAHGELVARAEHAERSLVAERALAAQTRGELTARVDHAEAAIGEARAAAERATTAAERANAAAALSRGRAEGLETELERVRQFEAESRADVERARAEIASLQAALTQARAESEAAHETARHATERLELELRQSRAPVAPAVGAPLLRPPTVHLVEPAPAESPSGPTWSHSAQRALAASLADATEWRTGLKDVLRILGTEGGWDVAVAWCPDERASALRCLAMWMSAPDQLGLFETATWQRRQSLTASKVGRVATTDRVIWLDDLGAVDDAQLAAAAGEGIQAALLVPIRRGDETIGVLELLTRAPLTPSPEIAAAMEAVALQLAHFEYLLRQGAAPRWRIGRM